MANVLFVTCNLKRADQSRSLTAGNEFLQAFQRINPGDRIDVLNLYRDPVQRIDADVLNGWDKLRLGQAFASLSETEQEKVTRINMAADQFAAADKYVVVTPMWNLGFPAELKMYIDTVCVVGKTFVYTEQGPKGLLSGRGKKCLHIHSSGGFHHGTPEDHAVPYLKSIMNFMGIEEFQAVVIEGVDALPHKANEIVENALAECREVAATF